MFQGSLIKVLYLTNTNVPLMVYWCGKCRGRVRVY